ncbi:Maf-like protein [Xylanibacillus composti]|uniref:dTTP/UTP pyrophosphatase n=1 Tax=Xylanibacillus composti TaxID=1572762 RepID=A0A8J4H7D9_9BACL|nr:Maf family protein [Xylanibacillus composti]GIQ70178.1 Maf-like protein [Xylanibacillus composti]
MKITADRPLILASSSPRRQELIRMFHLPVRIEPTDVDETMPPGASPVDTVEQLSLRKADAAAARCRNTGQDGIVIGSDTVVAIQGTVLGKPTDEQEAAAMLQRLQGQWHEVYSGIACIDLKQGTRSVRHRSTRVHMKPLSDAQIRSYVETGEPMDKAGAYAIQGRGALFVDRIEGCYFNVVGLPLSLLADMLDELE